MNSYITREHSSRMLTASLNMSPVMTTRCPMSGEYPTIWPIQWPGYHIALPRGQTHTCENVTFPKLRLRTVITDFFYLLFWLDLRLCFLNIISTSQSPEVSELRTGKNTKQKTIKSIVKKLGQINENIFLNVITSWSCDWLSNGALKKINVILCLKVPLVASLANPGQTPCSGDVSTRKEQFAVNLQCSFLLGNITWLKGH